MYIEIKYHSYTIILEFLAIHYAYLFFQFTDLSVEMPIVSVNHLTFYFLQINRSQYSFILDISQLKYN